MPDYRFKKTPQFSLKVAKEKEQRATPHFSDGARKLPTSLGKLLRCTLILSSSQRVAARIMSSTKCEVDIHLLGSLLQWLSGTNYQRGITCNDSQSLPVLTGFAPLF